MLFLPKIDIVKLDRSLISRLEHSVREATVVAGIIDVLHRLGIVCVAEGIERESQMELLKKLNCDRLRGYYIGKPMPSKEFFLRLAQRKEVRNESDQRPLPRQTETCDVLAGATHHPCRGRGIVYLFCDDEIAINTVRYNGITKIKSISGARGAPEMLILCLQAWK